VSGWRFGNRSADGVVKHWRPDGKGGIEISITQQIAEMLERNKAMTAHNDGYTPSREIRRAASIPASVRLKWIIEEGWDWMMHDRDPGIAQKLAAKLNDPDWAHLRTAPGRISVSNGVMR
jgi:hypothetical protein